MIDNLITDNLIINITSLSITVKEKSSLDKLAFWLYIQNIVMKQCFELRGDTMAKQIEGVYENVLRCARREFLEKGAFFQRSRIQTVLHTNSSLTA